MADKGMFGIDWDGDGKVDWADDALTMAILDDEEGGGGGGGGSGGGGGGCYVATCVYGSYDCPPVWTLRRFRDFTLAESVWGRAFVKAYYAVSPKLVTLFGDSSRFKAFWKSHLDRLVSRLNAKGVEDTPYKDREW